MLQRREFIQRAAVGAALSLAIAFTSVPAHTQSDARHIAALANRTWGIKLDLPGFRRMEQEVLPDGRLYLYIANDQTKVLVTVTLEEILPQMVKSGCREVLDFRAKRNDRVKKKDVKLTARGPFVALEYLVPAWEGKPIRQKNIFLCMLYDDVFVDVHLSKVEYEPEDNGLFQEVIENLKVREDLPRSSFDYFFAGSGHYLARKYKLAIPSYERALAMEKESPQLEKEYWYRLIDNLGMAYAITGELQRAKETFEYGLSKDAEYPLFYYHLACTYAEMGDKDRTIANLRKAFEYKANILPGEKMSDPAKDDSFQKFMKDAQFRELVNSFSKELSAMPPPPKPAAGYLTFRLVKAGDSGSSVFGTSNGKAGPITDAEVVLFAVRDEKCEDAFNRVQPTKETLAALNQCVTEVATTRPDANGRFEFKSVAPGSYSLRLSWNLAPRPQEAPTTYFDGQFMVMFTGQKDASRYDTWAQSRPFRFRKGESAEINFFDLNRNLYRIIEGRP